MRNLKAFWAPLAILLIAVSAQAGSPAETVQMCLPLRAADRSADLGCAAAYPWGKGTRLCLPQGIFLQLMEGELSRCGTWEGRWKVSSASVPEGDPKVSSYRFTVSKQLASNTLDPSRLAKITWPALQWVERARERVSENLGHCRDDFGVLKMLLLGEESPQGAGQVLHFLGFVHLLHATGIHLYVLAELIFSAIGFFVVQLTRILHAEGESAEWVKPFLIVARVTSWGFSAFGWALCGFRQSLLRPWVVVACRRAARAFGFRWRKFSPLILSLGIDAFLLGDFSLSSFAYGLAVTGALISVPEDRAGSWRAHFRLALGSWSLTALFGAWSDGWISGATPLLSLATLPIYTLLIYPALMLSGLLATCGFRPAPFFLLAGKASGIVLSVLVRLSLRGPWLWLVPHAALLGGALLATLAWMAMKKKDHPRLWRGQVAGAGLFIAICLRFAVWTRLPPPPRPEISQLDVGQGDAALVLSRNYGVGLIDAGSEHRVGELAWLRLIGRRNLHEIPWIAITHFDEDHVGGVRTLARLIGIGCLSTSREELESERGQRIRAELQSLGVRVTPLEGGCVPLPHLGPVPGASGGKNANMSAFVVPLTDGGVFFSAGDAEGEDEVRIGRWMSGFASKGPRILKISHHGSKTSSAPEFLKLVHPTEAWISAGVGNPYGHPQESVLARLDSLGIPVHRTDREGTLMQKTD